MHTLFEKPDASHFSLGEGFFEHYMTSAEPMSAAAHLANHMVWSSILDASRDWSRLRAAWLSVLAPRGLLLRGPGGLVGVVRYASMNGMLLLRCSMQRKGDLLDPLRRGGSGSHHDGCLLRRRVRVEGLDRGRGQAAPPPQVARNEGFGGRSSRILLSTPKSSTKPLLSACADTGFRQLTVPLLQRLIDELQIPFAGKRPTLEREVAVLVIQWVYPSMSAEEVDAFVERHKLRKPREFQPVLREANAIVVEAACGGERGTRTWCMEPRQRQLSHSSGRARLRFGIRHLDRRAVRVPRPPAAPARLPIRCQGRLRR